MRTNTPTRKGRILKIELVRRCDEYADTSYIGEYSDEYSSAAIVCETGEFVIDIERRKAIMARCDELAGFPALSDNPARAEYWSRKADRLSAKWDDLNRIPAYNREYRFFVPYAGGEPVGSKNWRLNAKQDFDRMQSFSNGDWCHLGIMTHAEITLPGSDIVQRITSGGLWGVQSDSGEEYLSEVEQEELTALAAELAALGFGKRAIALAMKAVERVDK